MMKFTKLLVLSALLTILSLSCEVTPETYEGEPNIYAILTTDSFPQVMVGRTLSINDTMKVKITVVHDTFWDVDDEDTVYYVDTIITPLWNGVSGAEVNLKQAEQSFSLTENEDSVGYYYSDFIELVSGQTWELEVTYPTGEEISAQTTIPGSFEIISPLVDTLTGTDTVTWTPSVGATGYSIRARIWVTWEDMDAVIVLTYPLLVSKDTTSLPVTEIFYPSGDSAVIFVSALDTNAYDYRYYWDNRWDSDIRVEDYMHIEGAWGVFGSQSIVRSRCYILPADTLYSPEE